MYFIEKKMWKFQIVWTICGVITILVPINCTAQRFVISSLQSKQRRFSTRYVLFTAFLLQRYNSKSKQNFGKNCRDRSFQLYAKVTTDLYPKKKTIVTLRKNNILRTFFALRSESKISFSTIADTFNLSGSPVSLQTVFYRIHVRVRIYSHNIILETIDIIII